MKKFTSIRTKLIAAMMLVSSIGMAIIAIVFFLIYFALQQSRLLDRINTELDFFSQNLGAALLFEDQTTAEEMLSTLSVEKAVISAKILNANQRTLATYELKHHHKVKRFNLVLHQHTQLNKDIILDGDYVGNVSVTITNEELLQNTHNMLLLILAIYLASVLAAYIIAKRMQLLLSQPILSLHQLLNKVTKTRNYHLRAQVQSRDEIGELTQQVNAMLVKIEQRDTMLAKQVQQRTAELEKLAEEFRHRAFHDVLTGLRNRAYLNEYIESAFAHAERHRFSLALLLLDLDNFKIINDTLGHDAGDELLKTVSRRLKKSVRSDDLVIRLGGDEFVILLEEVRHINDISLVANTILNALRDDILIKEHRIQITASIGGSLYPDHGRNLITLKRNADIAMYDAKDQGRNRYCLFKTAMEDVAIQRLIVQNDLRDAFENDLFVLHYQPKIDTRGDDDCMVGCEVLVRWQHPDRGILYPDAFIPIAEEKGLVNDIDYLVLEKACLQTARWKTQLGKNIAVAVNLSAGHFANNTIINKIQSALTKANIPASLLEIEITEATLINDPQVALKVLLQVRELGVKINLDDFGTGYSSLNYLRTLPVDTVKLDKSFVNNILTNPYDERITKGIIALTKGLELEIIAEGVESSAQANRLIKLGCYLMQGYYYLKPCNAKQFSQWFQAQKSTPSVISHEEN